MRHVRDDAMRDSILSRPLPRCVEMEPARVRAAVGGNGVRSVRVRDAHNARAAYAHLFFHATGENICPCLGHRGACLKLVLFAFPLARLLGGWDGALRPNAVSRRPCRARSRDYFLRALCVLRG